MRVLVIPDVHLKPRMFEQAAVLMRAKQADRAVCLMDIPDDWGKEYDIALYEQTYDAAIDLQEGTGYMFRVNAPFDESPDAAPNYFACFDFDPEGNFTDVFLQINPVRDNSYTLTESVVSTDAQAVSARIQAAFEEATK